MKIWDKLEHAVSYLALALCFSGSLKVRLWKVQAIGLLLFGALIEIAQGAMAWGRTADVRDLFANTAGIIAGLLLARTLLGRWAFWLEAALPGSRARR